jgi:hypothetical protein
VIPVPAELVTLSCVSVAPDGTPRMSCTVMEPLRAVVTFPVTVPEVVAPVPRQYHVVTPAADTPTGVPHVAPMPDTDDRVLVFAHE